MCEEEKYLNSLDALRTSKIEAADQGEDFFWYIELFELGVE
jgi:hypothetical protein